MARPRNNIMKLSPESRVKICELLVDGATYDDCRNDDLIRQDCEDRNLVLHNTTFKAFMETVEFDEFRRCALKHGEDKRRDRIAAEFVRDGGSMENMVDVANFKLMRRILEGIEGGEEIEAKELASLARAMKTAADNQHEKKEAALIEKHNDEKAKWQTERTELTAKIAELSATINDLVAKKNDGVDGNKIADKLNELLGL